MVGVAAKVRCSADDIVEPVPDARVASLVRAGAVMAAVELGHGVEAARPRRGWLREACGGEQRDAGQKDSQRTQTCFPFQERDEREDEVKLRTPPSTQ